MKYQLRDYQQEWVRQVFAHWANGKKRVLGQLPTGGGKCLVKDTPVLMYDGTIKAVQDIVPGDMLMGDGNDFVQLANRLKMPIHLSGSELVFESEKECINHHT